MLKFMGVNLIDINHYSEYVEEGLKTLLMNWNNTEKNKYRC